MIRSLIKDSEKETGEAMDSEKRDEIRRKVKREFYLEELEIDYEREKVCLNNLRELVRKGYFGY